MPGCPTGAGPKIRGTAHLKMADGKRCQQATGPPPGTAQGRALFDRPTCCKGTSAHAAEDELRPEPHGSTFGPLLRSGCKPPCKQHPLPRMDFGCLASNPLGQPRYKNP